MAKNVEHIQHLKSSVVIENQPKLPLTNALVEGELAVNYADGFETISLKNTNGEIVRFSSDDYFSAQKLGSGFTGENSAMTVTEAIEQDELVISAALTELDERVNDKADENHEHASSAISSMTGYEIASSASPITSADTLNVALGKLEKANEEINMLIGSGFTSSSMTEVIVSNQLTIAAALTDLDWRLRTLEDIVNNS